MIANRYTREIHNSVILLPKLPEIASCVWHQYVIRCGEKDRLIHYLDEKEIGTIIHYLISPHLSEAYAYLSHGEGFWKVPSGTIQKKSELLKA